MISPIFLTVPGLLGSGDDHWQTRWERERSDTHRIDLGDWENPNRTVWMSRIDQAVAAARGPVVLVAHSLGCQAVTWWANASGPSGASSVLGAVLVAPPATDRPDLDPRIARFGNDPRHALPFVSLLVASEDDPYATMDESRALARKWGAGLVDIGRAGHINARSGLAHWPQGQAAAELLRDARTGNVRTLARQAQAILLDSDPNPRTSGTIEAGRTSHGEGAHIRH
ncbi:RBBP9/YdeN family alpha/beta hydrolase [Sphingomonas glacialis]|uniref:Alpha/beta hydrolase n=1 Tax=Sphingomonas glacialis TaxID=658225 RepID=A0A502FWY3_9SPHN|nr:alpha/beta hydrolase [Sphingomonas glacialis]TPG54005.1 alpha/beta hydrolase [Sphingomonas glacialis]